MLLPHYERIARVIGRVIHDQARAEELAVEVFLKGWRNPQAHDERAEGWVYRTAVREAFVGLPIAKFFRPFPGE